MNTDRECTPKRVAAALNAMPADQLWALADSALLQAIARVEPVQRGPRGRRLRRLLGWADRLGLARTLFLITGGVELLKLLHRQGFRQQKADNGLPAYLFVGFGAGPEEALFASYTAEHAGQVARLNQVDVATFGAWQRLGLSAAMAALRAAHRRAWQAVSQLPAPYQYRRLDFITFSAMRLGVYSYMHAWFKALGTRQFGLKEICFLAGDTPAFAAVDAGLVTRHLQHGLIRHSLILPAFDRVDALTRDELRHFERRLPQSEVHLVPGYPYLDAKGLSGGILIASINGEYKELMLIEPFLVWANAQGLPLWVRRHPCEDPAFWAGMAHRHLFQIEDVDSSFQDALQRLRPSLVVSWYSTALADAPRCGIIPVTVSESTSPVIQDMVYPLIDRALQWPVDQAQIQQVLQDPEQYRQTLLRLQGVSNQGLEP